MTKHNNERMDTSRVNQVTSAFKTYLGRNPLSQELQSYVSSKGDVNAMVKSTSEYRLFIKQRLDQVFRTLLDRCADDAACDAFLERCEKDGFHGHTCARHAIQAFVANTPEYIKKYSSLVDDVFILETGCIPDTSTRNAMAKLFSDESFGPNDLVAIIKANGGAHLSGGSDLNGQSALCARYVPVVTTKIYPSFSNIDAYTNSVDSGEGTEDKKSLKLVWTGLPEMNFISVWKEATGARVDIYEFLRYYNELGSSPTVDKVVETKTFQTQAFQIATGIYKEFIGVDLSFERFCAEHMIEYDKPDFKDVLIYQIVNGFEYHERMRDTISRIYTKTFDESIHVQDLEHCFGIAKSHAMPMCGDGVSMLVISLGEELRTISSLVTAEYKNVLNRSPDSIEIRNMVADYRTRDWDDVQKDIDTSLYNDIEFQEVFKAIVTTKTGFKQNSEIFRFIRSVLAECSGDMKIAVEKVESYEKPVEI